MRAYRQMSNSVPSKKRGVSGPDSKVDSYWSPNYSAMFGTPSGPSRVSYLTLTDFRVETIAGSGEGMSKNEEMDIDKGLCFGQL
ncbi:hypothetical protein A6R68_09508 [Neotoma lepida]|uniref:Uncharacterized protein n=1 Tax=Neotoma lepida TaxID=56216 RepID=A0A1A6G0J8_NEOLE|nr:hypothetical protein A6R68_09508 [Neotoma lepida]